MSDLTHFSLFTGIGGIDLAAEWAGFTTVGQVEKNKFCQKVLTKHWPDVPGWEDINDVTAESFRERTGIERPTIISGGFPCQPYSVAGDQKGADDDRDLWPEMFEIVRSLRPDWMLGENVAGFTGMGLDRTLSDLEGAGYNTRAFSIPACAVNTGQIRNRVFIAACSGKERVSGQVEGFDISEAGQGRACSQENLQFIWDGKRRPDSMPEPLLRGGTDDFPRWVDRVKALGNAVVPQQVYPILESIAQIEEELDQ